MDPVAPRPRARPSLFFALAVAVTGLFLANVEPPPAAPPEKPLRRIVADRVAWGEELRRTIAKDEAHVYPFFVEKGQYVGWEGHQEDVDVVLTIVAPNGDPLFRVDMPSGPVGPESIYWIADRTGPLTLEVTAFGEGTYRLTPQRPRPPTDTDHDRAEALRLMMAAMVVEYGPTPDDALPHLRKAADALERVGDQQRLAMVLFHEGRRFWYTEHDARRAVSHLAKAAQLFKTLDDDRWTGRALNTKGFMLEQSADYQAAEQVYLDALIYRRRSGDRVHEAITLTNLGEIQMLLGLGDMALDNFSRAIEISRELGQVETVAAALMVRADCLNERGEYLLALDDIRSSLSILQKGHDHRRTSDAHRAMGELLSSRGFDGAALDHYHQALKYARMAGDERGIGISINRIGTIHYRNGRYEETVEAARHAVTLLRQNGNTADMVSAYLHMARALIDLGRLEEVDEALRSAENYLKDVGAPRLMISYSYFRARSEQRAGRLERALNHAARAIHEVEAVRGAMSGPSLRASYASQQRYCYDLMIELLVTKWRSTRDRKWLLEALSVAERSKARMLLETIGATDGSGLGSLRYDGLLRARGAIGSGNDQVSAGPSGRLPRSPSLEKWISSLMFDFDRSRPIAPSEYRGPSIESIVSTVQSEIDESTAVVEFHLAEEQGYAWIVSRDGIDLRLLPGLNYWQPHARTLHTLLANSRERRGHARLQAEVNTLRRALEGVFRHHQGRLVLVLDGPLNYIPIDLLREGGSSVRQGATSSGLGHVSYVPSLSVLLKLGSHPGRRDPLTALAIGDPVFDLTDERLPEAARSRSEQLSSGGKSAGAHPMRLPFSMSELDAVGEALGSSNVRIIHGVDATRGSLTEASVDGVRVLHLATHGTFDADHPELSHILLSRYNEDGEKIDGILLAGEVAELDLAVDLAVLTSCESALGAEVLGEGFVGMVHALMTAGARRVLVSLWAVDDRASAAFMRRFYSVLAERWNPAEALSMAREEIRATPGWGAPYYWAGYVLQGDWKSLRSDGVGDA